MKRLKNIVKNHYQALIAALIFLFAYAPIFVWMWDRWFAAGSYYSHGILIPFVTIFLIWQKKEKLSSLDRKESLWGIPLVVAGLIMHVMGILLRFYFVSGFSMLFILIGLILCLYGSAIFKSILFPLTFLIFMVPVPEVVITNISFEMKIFAAKIATTFLNNSGIPAIRDGSVIRMRHAQVVVDDVCSGLRSLISLMALGSIVAYWMKASLQRKYVLFLTTIPIAIVTNVCRIIFLASVSEIWGVEYAAGFLHDASGFLVFVLAFVLLFVVGRVLE